MEDTGISEGCCQRIGLGECPFTALQILKPKAFDICSEVPKLAEAIVGMAMEGADKASMA